MAVSVVTGSIASKQDTSEAAPETLSFTTSAGANRLLFVTIGFAAASVGQVTGVTYGGVAMTQAWAGFRSSSWRSYGYYLVAPATGTADISVTLTGSYDEFCMGAIEFNGVHQTTPVGTGSTASGSSATPSVDIAADIGDYVIDHMFADATSVAADASQTMRWEQENIGGALSGGTSTEVAASTTVTMSWTIASNDWVTGGIAIKPATTNFPFIAATATATDESSPFSLPMPAGVVAGDLLIAVYLGIDGDTFPLPSGWSALQDPETEGELVLTAIYKEADGSETSVEVATGVHGLVGWTMRITGWDGITPPEATRASATANATANPPSETASWGAANNLWIAFGGLMEAEGSNDGNFTAAPTNYTSLGHYKGTGDGSFLKTSLAYRNLNAATEDPGTFTEDVTTVDYWQALTIVVCGAAGLVRRVRFFVCS